MFRVMPTPASCLFLYNGVRPRNVMPVHGTWRHLRANAALAVRAGVPQENDRAGRERRQRRPGRGQGVDRGAVPVGKMFVDGLVTGDVGEATLGERLIAVVGFHRGHRGGQRGTGKLAAPPHLHSRGFSEDPKALEPVARKVEEELETLAAENVTDVDPHRPGRAPRRRQVGGRGLPPPADDRADGHRDLGVC